MATLFKEVYLLRGSFLEEEKKTVMATVLTWPKCYKCYTIHPVWLNTKLLKVSTLTFIVIISFQLKCNGVQSQHNRKCFSVQRLKLHCRCLSLY